MDLADSLTENIHNSRATLNFFSRQIVGITRLFDIFKNNRDFFGGMGGENVLEIIADKLEEILSEESE